MCWISSGSVGDTQNVDTYHVKGDGRPWTVSGRLSGSETDSLGLTE